MVMILAMGVCLMVFVSSSWHRLAARQSAFPEPRTIVFEIEHSVCVPGLDNVAFRSTKERSLKATFAKRRATIFLRFRLKRQPTGLVGRVETGRSLVVLFCYN